MDITFPRENPVYQCGELTLVFPSLVDGERTECRIFGRGPRRPFRCGVLA
jgi:hypothetical protein